MNQLQNTIGGARAYLGDASEEKLPTIHCSYIADILEDIAILEKYRSSFKEKESEALELMAEARGVKCKMEKEAYRLETEMKRDQNVSAITMQMSKPSNIKLPRLKLPTFDGETGEDYRGFIDAFNDALSVEPALNAVKKWLLLKAQLSGRALSLVKELPTAPETYEVASKILEDTYGSTKRAIWKLYQRVQTLPEADMATESLRDTHSQLEGMLLSLKKFAVPVEDNDFLRAVVMSKYPEDLLHFLRVTDDTTLKAFREAVNEYLRVREGTGRRSTAAPKLGVAAMATKGGAEGQPSKKPRHVQGSQNAAGGTGTPIPPSQVTNKTHVSLPRKAKERTRSCVFCTGNHWNDECDTHKTLEARLKLVKERCPKCLKEKHEKDAECGHKRVCYYCKEATHNSALCPRQFAKVLLTKEDGTAGKPSRFITAKIPVGNTSRTLQEEPRAVLDTCGSRSLITAELAARLELQQAAGPKIRFIGLNDVALGGELSGARKLLLYPSGEKPVELEVYVVPEIVRNVVSTDVNEFKKKYPRFASLPMPAEGNGDRVELLLGYRALTALVTLNRSIAVTPWLQLLSTKFGWVPFGSLEEDGSAEKDSSFVGLIKEQDPVKLMSDLELVGLGDFLKTENEEEAVVLEKFYESIQRLAKRYEVEWPYRYEDINLKDNFGLAFGRLTSLLRQLSKNPTLLAAYDRLIRDQLEEGIIEPVNFLARTRRGRVHYLPHRAIIWIGKSTLVRMVFDAAARSHRNAPSLNDVILKGGNWVTEIPGVMMRFRRYGVAVTSDIVKAFHQISIASKDRDVVRFLWLRDPSKPPTKENVCAYRFRRMAFGVVASPFLLTATIRHHLRTFPNDFSAMVERDLYADNLIVSLPSTVEGKRFYEETKSCFAEMSMVLAQWASDDEATRSSFKKEDAAEGTVQSVLGMDWNVNEKTLGIRSPKLPNSAGGAVTKRVALSEMATVYDPLGWASPVVLKARLFIRRVWREKYDWETPLSMEMRREWEEIREELNQVVEIKLPRPYGFDGLGESDEMELHIFCDASAEAYGVVVYLCVRRNGRAWTGLVASKTPLAPNSGLSIPRLELLAAVTASRYAVYVERALQENKKPITKYLWGDSKCVIAWSASKKILPKFVEKSVQQIKAAEMKRFLYVPTAQNPADVASRGASVNDLRKIEWWSGPSWLADQQNWPPQNSVNNEENRLLAEADNLEREENERILFFKSALQINKRMDPKSFEGSPFEIDPNGCQTMGALVRRTAICLRAAGRFLRGRGTIPATGRLRYREAWCRWLRWDQRRMYEPLEKGKTNASYLRNLRVSEDEHGVLRCETQIEKANVGRGEAKPVLLVKRSALTRLVIISVHRNVKHAGRAHTLAALRQQFWLPQGRREVYQTIKEHCFTCRREVAQSFKAPEMAPLPMFRINRTETPFTNVGVDTFRPFKVRVEYKGEITFPKRWVIIFACLVVRAVHLEVLMDMTAEEFLNSFRRFVGRRGTPRCIVCDNAPQFYNVEGYFQSIWHRFSEADPNEKYYAEHQIEWRFVPPEAPWMGGGV